MLGFYQPQEPDTSLYGPALDAIKNFIKTSTSSMTAVPKPLKFLRPHYDDLTEQYEKWAAGSVKVGFSFRFSTSNLTLYLSRIPWPICSPSWV